MQRKLSPFSWPEEIDILPLRPDIARYIRDKHGIYEEEIHEVLWDDEEMVAAETVYGTSRGRLGKTVLIMGRTHSGKPLEIAANYHRERLWIFHAQKLRHHNESAYRELVRRVHR